jgi:hypothetical protein
MTGRQVRDAVNDSDHASRGYGVAVRRGNGDLISVRTPTGLWRE